MNRQLRKSITRILEKSLMKIGALCFISLIIPLAQSQVQTPPQVPLFASVISIPGSSSGFTDIYNCVFSDNIFVTNTSSMPANGNYSDYLAVSDFGFSIPQNAVITGITVTVERTDLNGKAKDNRVRIIKNGTIGTTDKSTTSSWPATELVITYGSTVDTWGETWTPADINSPDFGFAFSIQRTGGGANPVAAKIDQITVSVNYSPAALPVVITDHSFISTGDHVKLEWTTARETNVQSFVITRTDENNKTDIVGEITAAGTLSSGAYYLLTDQPEQKGNYLYCLSEISASGSKTELLNQKVYFDPGESYSMNFEWTDPTLRNPDIIIDSPKETKAEIVFVDGKGNVLFKSDLNLHAGKNQFHPSENPEASGGIIFVLLFVEGKIIPSKFLAK